MSAKGEAIVWGETSTKGGHNVEVAQSAKDLKAAQIILASRSFRKSLMPQRGKIHKSRKRGNARESGGG